MQIKYKTRNTTVCYLNKRIKILTEMYCSYQYLWIDPKKSFPRPL